MTCEFLRLWGREFMYHSLEMWSNALMNIHWSSFLLLISVLWYLSWVLKFINKLLLISPLEISLFFTSYFYSKYFQHFGEFSQSIWLRDAVERERLLKEVNTTFASQWQDLMASLILGEWTLCISLTFILPIYKIGGIWKLKERMQR